jgi:radical SAM protein with 4Fe4S-binding SPASM domain
MMDNLKEKIRNKIKAVFPQQAYTDHEKRNHPCSLIFLMKNLCNARCVMCGLSYANNENVAEISLKDYQTMLNNLDIDKVKEITFSGGGDPLLCKDLLNIVDYTNQTYPYIKLFTYTNGIALTEEFSKEFIKHNFCQIVISINASTAETQRKIMQVDVFEKVVANIRQLVDIRNRYGAKTKIQFSFVASMLNIDDLPGLITLGAEMGVDEISMQYCRFYSKKFKVNSNDSTKTIDKEYSLFFHQTHSDEKVKQAVSIAKARKIKFRHEPLFSNTKLPKQRCTWPWTTILIGPQGEIYPCGGGEVIFYKALRDHRFYFGNILKEHISKFWNNEDYKRLRQSCDYRNRNKSIPQCWNCNHTLDWEGVNSERSYFIDTDI